MGVPSLGDLTVPSSRFTLAQWQTAGATIPNTSGWAVINVTQAPYNAVGDGATDDRTAIQNAIDQAGTDGNTIVYFPGGTQDAPRVYRCLNNLRNLKSTVVLRGDLVNGRPTSIVEHHSTSLTNHPFIRASSGYTTIPYHWRQLVEADTAISFTAPSTINKTNGNFPNPNWAYSGNKLTVTGSTGGTNDATYTIASNNDNNIVVNEATITTQAAGPAIDLTTAISLTGSYTAGDTVLTAAVAHGLSVDDWVLIELNDNPTYIDNPGSATINYVSS